MILLQQEMLLFLCSVLLCSALFFSFLYFFIHLFVLITFASWTVPHSELEREDKAAKGIESALSSPMRDLSLKVFI